jgi:hypothetical protein
LTSFSQKHYHGGEPGEAVEWLNDIGRRRIMKRNLVLWIVSVVFLVGAASEARAALTLYDSFNDGTTINPEKWSGSEGSAGSAAPSTESRRQISAKQLELRLTSWGGTESDSGNSGSSSIRLNIADPAAAQAKTIQAAVSMPSAGVEGCDSNAYDTNARARIAGGFFNDGSSTGASDRTGDIMAAIEKIKDSSGVFVIRAWVARCKDATCSTTGVFLSHDFTSTWTETKADTLKLQWVPSQNKFIFTVNPGPLKESYALSYNGLYTDTHPAIADFRHLAIYNYVANCTSARKSATTRATFDAVYTAP